MTRVLRAVRCLVAASLVVATPHVTIADGDVRSWQPDRDCGRACLFMLLASVKAFELTPVVEAHLPEPSQEGYSLRELHEAAAACGLALDFVDLRREGDRLDRPMIALLRGRGKNHFVLVRPLRDAGANLQVIDPRGFSRIVGRSEWFKRPEWTGYALAVARPRNGRWRESIAAGVIAALAMHGICALARERGDRLTPAPRR